MAIPLERIEYAEAGAAQPETVATLLRQMGMRNASGVQVADILRSWLRDNVPNPSLRLSIRRNGYGFLLNRRFGRPPRLGEPFRV